MTSNQGEESAPFWEACNYGRLVLRHCLRCNAPFYPPRMACPRCGGTELEWRDVSGLGTIYTYTRAMVGFGGPDWESEVPYTSALIDLDEGVRLLSRLVGQRDDTPAIGARVKVTFIERRGRKLPCFAILDVAKGKAP